MPKTILIVEDYSDVRMMMKILIKSYGYQAIDAANGIEAFEKAKEHRPDLILMDLMMPVLDGLTATKLIRRFAECEKIPIIVLSAYGEEYQEKAVAAGCDLIIQKPLNFLALKPLLEKYLNR